MPVSIPLCLHSRAPIPECPNTNVPSYSVPHSHNPIDQQARAQYQTPPVDNWAGTNHPYLLTYKSIGYSKLLVVSKGFEKPQVFSHSLKLERRSFQVTSYTRLGVEMF